MEHTYRVTEIVGSSPDFIEHPIRYDVTRAGATLRHPDCLAASELRGHIADCEVGHFQVVLQRGLRVAVV